MAAGSTLLVYRKQLGDLVLLQPAIAHLARRYGAPVQVRTRPGFADVLALMPGGVTLAEPIARPVARVVCFDSKASSLADALGAFPARRHLVATRAEQPWWVPLLFNEVHCREVRDEYRGSLFFHALGGEGFAPPRLAMPPADWRPAGLPQRYAVIHPTSAWRRKTWPVASWISLLAELAPELPPLVITAGPEAWEQEMAAAIAAGLPAGLATAAGPTSLRAYLAILAGAAAVLTVDGSASHLAAAFGRRTLTLFGPTNPAHWHLPTPRSRRLWAADFTAERKPEAGAIPVPAALAAARELLREPVDD